MKSFLRCNTCLKDVEYDDSKSLVNVVEDGEESVFVEYVVCPFCGNPVVGRIYSKAKEGIVEV